MNQIQALVVGILATTVGFLLVAALTGLPL